MSAVMERSQKNVETRSVPSGSPDYFSANADLSRLLEEGIDDIRNGRVYTEAEMDIALELM